MQVRSEPLSAWAQRESVPLFGQGQATSTLGGMRMQQPATASLPQESQFDISDGMGGFNGAGPASMLTMDALDFPVAPSF